MKFLVCLVIFSLSVYLSEGKAFLFGSKSSLFNKGGYSDDNFVNTGSSGYGDVDAGAVASSGSLGLGGIGGGLGGGFSGILE